MENKLTKREKEILRYIKENNENKTELLLDIEDELYNFLKKRSEENNITVEEIVVIYIMEIIMALKKEEYQKKHSDKKIYDIFDMYNIENIINELSENQEEAIVLNTNDNHFVLIPANHELVKNIEKIELSNLN